MKNFLIILEEINLTAFFLGRDYSISASWHFFTVPTMLSEENFPSPAKKGGEGKKEKDGLNYPHPLYANSVHQP